MKNNRFLHSIIILVAALLMGFYALPGSTQKAILPFLPNQITDNKISLGLDLQGGSQLDYKIDLGKVPEKDRGSIVEGVINVIQKRVNGLGVSEPNIYSSTVGDENHIIVELAGIKDLDQAKAIVGKTIQLEFKTLRETPDPNHAEDVRKTAQAALDKLKDGKTDFKLFGEETSQANAGKVTYNESSEWQFADQIGDEISTELAKLQAGQISQSLFEVQGEIVLGEGGQFNQKKGFNIVKLLEKQNVDRSISDPRSVKTAHVLVAFKGANRAAESVTRTEEEAKKLADDLAVKLATNPADFEKLVQENSDDAGSKTQNGVLDTPVSGDQTYVKEYTDAALALQKSGDLSPVVKSPFGFHIIKAVEVKEASQRTEKQDQFKYARVYFDSADDPWVATDLNGQFFQRADVTFDQFVNPQVSITFNPEGAKLFEALTEKNVGKQIAIFVGGNQISAPTVNEKISGGQAVINGRFTIKAAENLSRDLNTGAIPAPVVLVGQYTIGASLGQEALNNSMQAGLIGLILVAIFMIGYYRLAGVIATIALLVYTALMLFLIKSTIPFQYSLPISIVIFIYLVLRVLNNKESGPEKMLTLILSCFILFFLSFLLSSAIVLTLAGIAGVILSIGMAVDANILIFERIKEEIRDGRELNSAIQTGFDRAWSSIKDSNFSSLITCAILYSFGSSLIQGFAFNLAAGILISMFTAITVTRLLLITVSSTKLGHVAGFFGHPKKKDHRPLQIIGKRKLFYAFSGLMLAGSIIAVLVFGLKPGMDFTGGSLMEIKFKTAPASYEDLSKSFSDIEKKINGSTQPVAITSSTSDAAVSISGQDGKLDLGTPHIYSSTDATIIKTKTMSAVQHDQVLVELKAKFGELEEKRFQSIGPTVGESLRYKAVMAVILASLMIVLYLSFAFRKVPRSVGKWRFGISTIIALVHDIIIMIGIYVVISHILNLEIDTLFITALLTTMGFSVHDSIVVLDRLREKLKAPPKDMTLEEMTNLSVNETMSRSINTSLTVTLALLSLVIFGPETIRAFNLATLIGIIVGTYSSIFIASFVLVDWYNWAQTKKTSK